MYCGTPTFWQRGLWDSCFQNPSESSDKDLKSVAYKTLVRPQLEYASIVWYPHTTTDINKVEQSKEGLQGGLQEIIDTPLVSLLC